MALKNRLIGVLTFLSTFLSLYVVAAVTINTNTSTVSPEDVESLKLYGVMPHGTFHIEVLTPENIRQHHELFIWAPHYKRGVIETIVNWLDLKKLKSYSLNSERIVHSSPVGIIMVVDLHLKNGSTESYYFDGENIYDKTMSRRYLVDCSFLKTYMEQVSFSKLRRDGYDILKQCEEHRKDPNWTGEHITKEH